MCAQSPWCSWSPLGHDTHQRKVLAFSYPQSSEQNAPTYIGKIRFLTHLNVCKRFGYVYMCKFAGTVFKIFCLYLALNHFQQILAPLNKGINLSEYGWLIKYPAFLWEPVVDLTDLVISVLPGIAATDAFLQSLSASLNKSIKHIVQRYLVIAPLYNVATHLRTTYKTVN